MNINFIIGGLFLLLPVIHAIGVDYDLSLDKTGWIDPNDPLSNGKSAFRRSLQKTLNEGCDGQCRYLEQEMNDLRKLYAALQRSREHSVDVLLKHVLGKMLLNLNIDLNTTNVSVYRKADVNLSADNLRIIRRYLSSQKTSEEFGLREDLRFAMDDFIVEADNRFANSLFSLVYWITPYIVILNIIILPAAMLNVLRSISSIRKIGFFILLTAFTMSCYFTYARKYQEVLAQRFERTEQRFDGSCTPSGLLSEAYNVLLSYVRIKGKSECLQHYEDMLIEPIWLIDPLQVVAEVMSNFIFTPISVAGGHLNKFFNDFFINTPIYLAVVKVIFLLMFLFYMTGYRLRTIFATIEPTGNMNSVFPLEHTRHALNGNENNISRDAILSESVKNLKLLVLQKEMAKEVDVTEGLERFLSLSAGPSSQTLEISESKKMCENEEAETTLLCMKIDKMQINDSSDLKVDNDQRRDSKNELIIADLMYRLRKEVDLVVGAKNILKILSEQKKPDMKRTKDAMDTHARAQEKIDLICLALRKYTLLSV